MTKYNTNLRIYANAPNYLEHLDIICILELYNALEIYEIN